MAIAVVLVVGVPLGVYIASEAAPAGATGPSTLDAFDSHIDHIVFVVLENHAFDNYFGTYCVEVRADCPMANNGLPGETCVPLDPAVSARPCEVPWTYGPSNWTIDSKMPHDQNASVESWDDGAMDGFYQAEGSGFDPFGHYDGTTAPIYWDLAEQYSLGDDFFSSVLDYSLPNHWHIVAGQAPPQVIANFTLAQDHPGVTVAGEHRYLDQANRTRSVEDLLLGSGIGWKYYDTTLDDYSDAIALRSNATTGHLIYSGPAYGLWNPQAAKAESYNSSFVDHFVNSSDFYGDAAAGELPPLSWVIPPGQFSDHPPQNSTLAQGWLGSIVDAVEASPQWNRTAMFITWDDYGGFYDHVPPPTGPGGAQLGFRVPLLIVSPYTRQGYISGEEGYFESILHLMEERFGLGCLTALDCSAPLPLDSFDFAQAPRPPMLFPTNVSNASYPMPLQPMGGGNPPLAPYTPPVTFTVFPQGRLPTID